MARYNIRAGADSDCNPATAAGVLGVMFGYDAIPTEWTAGLAAIEPLDFAYTTTSLEEVYELSFQVVESRPCENYLDSLWRFVSWAAKNRARAREIRWRNRLP